MKIVILAHQGIGDFIMMASMLRIIDDNLEEGDEITIVLCNRFQSEFLSALNLKHSFSVLYVRLRGARRRLDFLFLAFRLRRMRADILFAPLLYDRPENAVWLYVVKAKAIIAQPLRYIRHMVTNPVLWRVDIPEHQVRFYERCAEAAGFVPVHERDTAIHKFDNFENDANEERIGLCPGATPHEMQKCWPLARFSELLVASKGKGYIFVFFGSKEEASLIDRILEVVDTKDCRVEFVLGENFETVCRRMKQCRCIVAGTTGLGHLAAALNIPLVVPSMMTNPFESGPYTEKIWNLRKALACAPCYRREYRYGCREYECCGLIAVSDVCECIKYCTEGKFEKRHNPILTKKAYGYVP